MAYTKQTWSDNNLDTPISAARLNHMEDGIKETANKVDPLEQDVEELKDKLDNLEIEPGDILPENKILQNYMYKSVYDEGQKATYNNDVVAISWVPTFNSGYIKVFVDVIENTSIKILLFNFSNDKFVLSTIIEKSAKAGSNEFILENEVAIGVYIGVAFQGRTVKYVSASSNQRWTLQNYSQIEVGLEISRSSAYSNAMFGFDYQVLESYTGGETTINEGSFGKRTISGEIIKENTIDSSNLIESTGGLYQTYSPIKEEIEAKVQSQTLTDYNSPVISFRKKPISRNGFANVWFYSPQKAVVQVLLGTITNNIFTITKTYAYQSIAGYNTIKNLPVSAGEYIAFYYTFGHWKYISSSSLYVEDREQWIPQSFAGYPKTVGETISGMETGTTNTRFCWDYELYDGRSCVGTKNIDDNAITYQKLSPEVQALISQSPATQFGTFYNRKANISHLLNGALSTINIKLIGDSITHGYGATDPTKCWASLFKTMLEANYDCIVTNGAVIGINASDVANNLSTYINDNDDVVICMLGTNNRGYNSTLNGLYSDMETIAQYCESKGIKFIPIAPIPASLSDETSGAKAFHMDDIVRVLSAFAHNNKYELVDLYTELYKFCEYDNTKLDALLTDGLHPNDDGYYIVYRLISSALGVPAPIKGATWN